MINCCDFFLGCLVLIYSVHPLQMIVERRTGQLSDGKKNFERMSLPQSLNYQRFFRWRRSSSKTKVAKTDFQPVKGKYRKPGTGCVSQIDEHLWEGRYSPKINGKRMARNVYAHTEAECEENLANIIREMKAEIAAEKEQQKQAGLTG